MDEIVSERQQEGRAMSWKILVEEVPMSGEPLKTRRIVEPRGELVLIEDGKQFRRLACFSLKPGGGYFRGGHYHRDKVEHLYVISGRLRIRAADLETGERFEMELSTGSRVTIFPGCAHRFEAVEDARVIEYCDSVHNAEDDIRYEPLFGD
jgi:mannose-6-phosphate isomerase-like protein (cupin superfamily)